MSRIVAVFTFAVLAAGCGVESAGTAATAAAVKKQEIEAGKNTVQKTQEQVGQAVEQMQQRAQQAGDAGEK